MNRILIDGHGRVFIQEKGCDVHCQHGRVRATDIEGASDGAVVKSDTGVSLVACTPSFIDRYKRIRRDAQIITFKDAGVILATAGLGPESVVAEAGSGSGALTVFLARHCKHVYSYDIDKDKQAVAKENVALFSLTNATFREQDVAEGVPDEGLDCLILDIPEPWKALHVSSLRVGGYVVTYTPSTTQLQRVREAAEKTGLSHVRTVEVSERHWQVRGQAVRPTSRNVAFTAFLSFYRWYGPEWKNIRAKEPPKGDGMRMPDEDVMREAF